MHGVEVHRLTSETEIDKLKHPAGSFVVRMDQPYSRLADMVLDKQYYNPNDTQPYDDTGWTLAELRNLKSWRVTNQAILKLEMRRVTEPPIPEGRVSGQGEIYAVNHNADRALATFRFKLAGVKMESAEAAFESAGRMFSQGAFLIRAKENSGDLRKILETAAAETGVSVQALDKDRRGHARGAPRIALVHTGSPRKPRVGSDCARDLRQSVRHISTNTAKYIDLRAKWTYRLGPLRAIPTAHQRSALSGRAIPWDRRSSERGHVADTRPTRAAAWNSKPDECEPVSSSRAVSSPSPPTTRTR